MHDALSSAEGPADHQEFSETAQTQSCPSGHTGALRPPFIEVALATLNSEPFLAELLDSLFGQSEQNFTILVADDGSTDSTLDILKLYASRWPNRIRIVAQSRETLGPLRNFARLIDHASADYLMLCDHDDVWLPDKIELTLKHMISAEARQGRDTPLLVHTDLLVVDENLNMIDRSFVRYSNINPTQNDFTRLLTANVATGCTLMANRALYERARPVATEAMMHDHWLALVAANYGSLIWVDRPTILYRQHPRNAIGAQDGKPMLPLERVRQTLFSSDRQRVMRRYSRQAAALLRRYGRDMNTHQRSQTQTLATIWSVSRWRRFLCLWRAGLGLSGFIRNVALLIVMSRNVR